MCGIAGFVGHGQFGQEAARAVGERMGQAIVHRGPDSGGIWQDPAAEVVLVHRRLAIIDLTPAGHQPMSSASGRYVISFNGEIYNHLDLRAELANAGAVPDGGWHGHSDTETLLAAIAHWGIASALSRLIGMFVFALWDREQRALYLARDRMGEKPLYYGWQSQSFLFGSELKALRAHPAFAAPIDRDALALYLRHNYVPTPYSIYQGISKLPPGTWLRIDPQSRAMRGPEPYWRLVDTALAGQAAPYGGDEAQAVGALDDLLRDAIGRQMMADVPLGAFLSGGIDSSTVVALMQAQSARPIKTFTIGFEEQGYNEAVYAKAVARHLGTEHTELYVTPEQAQSIIPQLPHHYDEPFSDSSQIPTMLISAMTRNHVTVALSGDGGDELFAGYTRYTTVQNSWNTISKAPISLRRALAGGMRAIPARYWDQIGHAIARIADTSRWWNLASNVDKLAGILSSSSEADLYRNFISHWRDPASIVIGGTEHPSTITRPPIALNGVVPQMMALDALSYLPDDILVKVDRAAMAVSLETRVPFLDHRVVEFAWRIPLSMKIRNGRGKWILRQVLERYVPVDLIDRPKMGFGIPLNTWLRGPLRDWAEDLLDVTRLRQDGFFRPDPIRKLWADHLSGRSDAQYHLWDILMFQSWLDHSRTTAADH